MSDLYVFFKNLTVRTPGDLQTLCLGHLFDIGPNEEDRQIAFFHDWAGPENTTGTLVVATPDDEMPALEAPKYNQDRQTWLSLESGSAWLGFETADPPGPSDLRRRFQYVGAEAKLGDGNSWLLAQFSEFPLRMVLCPDGVSPFSPTQADVLAKRLTMELLQFFASLEDISAMVDSPKLCPPGCRSLVEHSLTKNYRGCWELFEKLGLFDVDPIVITDAAMAATGLKQKSLNNSAIQKRKYEHA